MSREGWVWLAETVVLFLTEDDTANTPRITLVCDNSEHAYERGVLYEAFPPEKAREYVRRINFRLHPQARQLAQRGGMRTDLHDQPMPV